MSNKPDAVDLPQPVADEIAALDQAVARLAEQISAIPDPVVRERAARTAIEVCRAGVGTFADSRSQAVRDLYERVRRWESVGQMLGVTGMMAHKIAKRGS